MSDTRVEAPKMFREMDGVRLENVQIPNAQETLWHCRNVDLKNVRADRADYLFLHGENIRIEDYVQNGNYSFQYCRNVTIRDAEIHSKDAFWNSEDVTVYDSVLDGEYLGWHSKRLKLVNCRISGHAAPVLCAGPGDGELHDGRRLRSGRSSTRRFGPTSKAASAA